jgi:hypothetical protein
MKGPAGMGPPGGGAVFLGRPTRRVNVAGCTAGCTTGLATAWSAGLSRKPMRIDGGGSFRCGAAGGLVRGAMEVDACGGRTARPVVDAGGAGFVADVFAGAPGCGG